jgi:hypothetical protein
MTNSGDCTPDGASLILHHEKVNELLVDDIKSVLVSKQIKIPHRCDIGADF